MAQLNGLVLYSSWYKSMAGEHKVCMISNVTSAKTCQQTLEKLYSPSASIPPVSREWKYRPTLQSDYKNSWDNMYCLSTWNILYKNVLLLFQLSSFFQIYLGNLFKTEESISNYLLACCTIGPNLKIVGQKWWELHSVLLRPAMALEFILGKKNMTVFVNIMTNV